MTRSIQPVELHDTEKKLVGALKKEAKRLTGKNLSVSAILRRSLQIAAPQMLQGDVPLFAEVSINPKRK